MESGKRPGGNVNMSEMYLQQPFVAKESTTGQGQPSKQHTYAHKQQTQIYSTVQKFFPLFSHVRSSARASN